MGTHLGWFLLLSLFGASFGVDAFNWGAKFLSYMRVPMLSTRTALVELISLFAMSDSRNFLSSRFLVPAVFVSRLISVPSHPPQFNSIRDCSDSASCVTHVVCPD